MPKQRCTYHKYVRRNRGKKSLDYIYACQDCTHYILPEFIPGKKARCCYCDTLFVIKPKDKKLKFIHCMTCTKPKHSIQAMAIDELMNELGLIKPEDEEAFIGEE